MKYGSREWLEAQYRRGATDPWGLDWRPSQQFRYQAMLDTIRRIAPPGWTPKRIIDVGCATGSFTSRLSELDSVGASEIIGVDVAETAILRAKQRVPKIHFERMDIAECAAQFSETADLVTCLEVLYYVPPEGRVEAIRSLRQMLRPDGLLLVSSMSAQPPYLTFDELQSLLASEVKVIAASRLYLKPLTFVEKGLMRVDNVFSDHESAVLRRLGKATSFAVVQRLAGWSESVLGKAACSHGFVIARRP